MAEDAESFAHQKREWMLRNEELAREASAHIRENDRLRFQLRNIEHVTTEGEEQSLAIQKQLNDAKKRAMEADMLAVNLTLAQDEIRDLVEEVRHFH